ncbi:hypothetical protein BDV19DRAFT_396748 [Aspergillus venezuelensis]
MATSFHSHTHHPFGNPTESLTHTRRLVPGLSEPREFTPGLNVNGTDHASILDWIRTEPMHKLPAEGSNYDRALVRARLFVERLHSFHTAIQQLVGESQIATPTQPAYAHCGSLLGLGEENSDALLDLFAFIYRCATELDHLLSRTELFAASWRIKDQVILALGDLVTLVVEIAAHFQNSLSSLTTGQWLEPEDPVLEHIVKDTSQFAQDREESTCLWRLIAVTGVPGSGKSILATVINDHLQHPIGGVSYQPIFVLLNSRIPALATPIAVAKCILSQLFASRIGNVALFKALATAYNELITTINEDKAVDTLWNGLKESLPATMQGARESVLVVDGVDECSCGQAALLEHLKSATANVSSLKLIVLGSEKHQDFSKQTTVQITPESISGDIAAVVRKVFNQHAAFSELGAEEQEAYVHNIVKASRGSFLWAKLASKQLRDGNPSNPQALAKDIGNFVKAGHSIKDLVSNRIKNEATSHDAVKILAWLATAARPLTIPELTSLLCVLPEKGEVVEKEGITPLQLLKPFASLVFYQNRMVCLRHGSIRTAINIVLATEKSVPAIREPQLDFIMRLSLCIKHALAAKHEPSLNTIDARQTLTLTERYPLLGLTLRYWLGHTRMTFGCNTDQEIKSAGKALGPVLPSSPLALLVEMNSWRSKPAASLALLHDTQTRIYHDALGANEPATLQAVLCQALFYQAIQEVHHTEASKVFYDTAKLCQTVLSVQHVTTMQLVEHFLDVTANQTSSSKTVIMSRRTEMLQILVECYKIHYGSTSEIVVTTMLQLANHYHAVGEIRKAQEITQSFQATTGETSDEDTAPRRLSDIEHDDRVSSSSTSLETLITRAERFVREGNVSEAERVYVDAWQQSNKEHRVQQSVGSELHSIKATMAISQFLRSQKRDTEARSILCSFWEEHQHSMSNSQEVMGQFVAVAKLIRSIGLSSVALEVSKQCTQRTSRESSLYKEIQQYTHLSYNEVIQSVESGTCTSSTNEAVLREIAAGSTSLAGTALDTLAKMYMSQHHWKDATKVLKRALQSVWSSLFTSSVKDVVLPKRTVQYPVDLAQRLRACYRYRLQTDKEENILTRLYIATRKDQHPGDPLLDTISKALVHFYQRTSQTNKLISTHREILDGYERNFGEEHPAVLKQLWTLAELTRPRADAVGFYQRIFKILNKDVDTCRAEAFEPLLIVATELVDQGRYADALMPCRVLFNTLKHPQTECRLREQRFVKSVYDRYIHCLHKMHAEYRVIHDVTVEYRHACLTVFGVKGSVTIEATKTLAQIALSSRQYQAEAVDLYKTLLHTASNEVDLDREDIEATLQGIALEQEQVVETFRRNSFHSQDTTKAIPTWTQRLSSARSTFSWTHETSLSQMEELVALYAKWNETQTGLAVLQEAVVEILTSDTSVSSLISAAKSIFSGYTTLGLANNVAELSQHIHRQAIVHDKASAKFWNLGITSSSSQRHALLFLAQLEYSLRESKGDMSLTMSEIHSALVAEYWYFECFRTQGSSKSTPLQDMLATVTTLLVEQFTDCFLSTHGKALQLERRQVDIFLATLLDHFRAHASQNFLRSVALACNTGVITKVSRGVYKDASDLAHATFAYLQAHNGFGIMATLKLIFKMGLEISPFARKAMSDTKPEKISEIIIKAVYLDAGHLNSLIKVLDRQKDYADLAWLLTSLWNKRDSASSPATGSSGTGNSIYTLALGRMLVVTRYLIGEYTSAIRLAEDIFYNSARVYGPSHPGTIEMSVFLFQIYTSVAQGYDGRGTQSKRSKDGDHEYHRELAYQYYRKAAALHENALRALIDPTDSFVAGSSSPGEVSTAISPGSTSPASPGEEPGESAGKRARKYLHLLKLAVERLGNWPKDYSDYEKLNADLFKTFGNDLRGVEGVEKWNPKHFGSGRAEASDDLVTLDAIPRVDLESQLVNSSNLLPSAVF